jgi:hypothetical protein
MGAAMTTESGHLHAIRLSIPSTLIAVIFPLRVWLLGTPFVAHYFQYVIRILVLCESRLWCYGIAQKSTRWQLIPWTIIISSAMKSRMMLHVGWRVAVLTLGAFRGAGLVAYQTCAFGRLLPTGRAIIAERLMKSIVNTSRMQMARAPRISASTHARMQTATMTVKIINAWRRSKNFSEIMKTPALMYRHVVSASNVAWISNIVDDKSNKIYNVDRINQLLRKRTGARTTSMMQYYFVS